MEFKTINIMIAIAILVSRFFYHLTRTTSFYLHVLLNIDALCGCVCMCLQFVCYIKIFVAWCCHRQTTVIRFEIWCFPHEGKTESSIYREWESDVTCIVRIKFNKSKCFFKKERATHAWFETRLQLKPGT